MPEVIYKQFAHFFWKISMNYLSGSSNIVAFVVRRYCADQACLEKYIPMVALRCVPVLQGQKFSAACWLARRDMDKKKHLLKKLI
jgi:hypothetical protein